MASIGQVNIFTLIIVIVAVIAVGVVAATLGSVVVYERSEDTGELIGHEEGVGEDMNISGNTTDGNIEDLEGGTAYDLQWCVRWLTEPTAVLGMFAGLFAVLYLVYLRFNLATAMLSGTFLLPIVMLAYFLLTNCPQGGGEGNAGLLEGINAIESSQEGLGTIPAIPPTLAAVILGGFMLVAVVVLFQMSGRDEALEESDVELEAQPDAADFARAAQRARERIEEANIPVDNAVYQAWLEMTGLLAMDNPETAAPYEFAEAAIDVGLAEDDVYELTELFNEVRYGKRDAATREDRALRVLRNIEETYDAVESSGDADE